MNKIETANKTRWIRPDYDFCDERLLGMFDSPHLLIGGETGSGKSTLLNAIMLSAITKYTPKQVHFYLVDTKKVELTQYKDLPHTIGFVKEAKYVPDLLQSVSNYMDMEYNRMESIGIRKSDRPHLYIVIDEIADLMLSSYSKDIKAGLQRILQIGRACNVHIIACTQSPSRKTLPAELVINFTNRVALHCASAIESRQILNQKGAEDISEIGACLYKSPMKGTVPLSGIPYYSEREIKRAVSFWAEQKVEGEMAHNSVNTVNPTEKVYTTRTALANYKGDDDVKLVTAPISLGVAIVIAMLELIALPFRFALWFLCRR